MKSPTHSAIIYSQANDGIPEDWFDGMVHKLSVLPTDEKEAEECWQHYARQQFETSLEYLYGNDDERYEELSAAHKAGNVKFIIENVDDDDENIAWYTV